MEKVKNMITLWKRGLISALDFWAGMYKLDQCGEITGKEWAYANSIVPEVRG